MLAVAAAAHLALPCVGSGAEAPAVVTLVEGQGVLLRPAGRFSLAEGVRVEAGDIVEVAEKGLVQIGFGDGTRLSLGPQSRVHVAALASRGAKAQAVSDFYLLRGWSKVATAAPAAPLRLSTPLFALATNQAVFVLQLQSKDASVFVEGGELRLPDGFVKAGQFYTRSAGQRGALQPRAPAAFVAAMPRPYQDNLPERLAKLKEREVPPRRLGELTYADVQAWLTGPSELRRPIVQRLRSRARDPEFRKALIANMPLHPEWDRIVFPDKYKPKSETP
jgi:hypothetical protein